MQTRYGCNKTNDLEFKNFNYCTQKLNYSNLTSVKKSCLVDDGIDHENNYVTDPEDVVSLEYEKNVPICNPDLVENKFENMVMINGLMVI